MLLNETELTAAVGVPEAHRDTVVHLPVHVLTAVLTGVALIVEIPAELRALPEVPTIVHPEVL